MRGDAAAHKRFIDKAAVKRIDELWRGVGPVESEAAPLEAAPLFVRKNVYKQRVGLFSSTSGGHRVRRAILG
jgi:hypothetical protein